MTIFIRSRVQHLCLALSLAACDHSEQASQLAPDAKHRLSTQEAGEADKVDHHLIWVYIDDGAIQCEKPALDLQHSSQKLEKAKVSVKKSACGQIVGTAIASLCGLKDLGIHLHQINQSDLKAARSLGFEPTSSLAHYGDKTFKFHSCPDSRL